MDRFRQKKKEKPIKHVEKDNPSFITDVKSIKENLKIKEILRTVKMNSSMRVKAPRGSKVMNSKDFNENDGFFGDDSTDEREDQLPYEPPSATNPDVIISEDMDDDGAKIESSTDIVPDKKYDSEELQRPGEGSEEPHYSREASDTECHKCNDRIPEETINTKEVTKEFSHDNVRSNSTHISVKLPVDNTSSKCRDRKLSLDHTLLSRRDSLSQSELDLNLIGKSPLERKSSFFRKKMDSFFKNTTEIFRRQSSRTQPINRRGSMSVSLQSLNEAAGDYNYNTLMKNTQGSVTSLQCLSTESGRASPSGMEAAAGSDCGSLPGLPAAVESDRGSLPGLAADYDSSLAGSQPSLSASVPLGIISADSAQSLNESCDQNQSLLNTRAISMSSGLDAAPATRRQRKSSNRSNRVTWLASEGLTNYFRRLYEKDEKPGDISAYHSYSDFGAIPEHELSAPRTDSKGRRLSYQRAVSGEDPVRRAAAPATTRRHLIPENSEASYDLSNLLAEFSRNGVPPLTGFAITNIPNVAFAYLHWAERPSTLEEFYESKINEEIPPDITPQQLEFVEKILLWENKTFNTSKLSLNEEARQAVIRELVNTEAVHIRHLISVVEVFIAAAHALQDAGKLLGVDTERLFSNIPDVLNASLIFWEVTIYPMLVDAVENMTPYNTEFMSSGFCRFREIFSPYEKFVSEQTKALDYLRSLSNNADFMMYLTWCHSQKECKRLQLADILVKPMQRLTKYSLILKRIIAHTDTEPERTSLIAMENFAKNYVLDLNRSIRQREELEKLDQLVNSIEGYDIDFKDEDMDRYFRMFSQLNLKASMVNCLPSHSRTIIYQGDLRFKDQQKEAEVRVYLLTDMLLICKKQSKGSNFPYKMIRPKYMVDKMLYFAKLHPKNSKEVVSLTFVVVDEVGSSYQSFQFTETTKDPNAQGSLRLWEQKLKEARLTYDLGVWFAKNPSRDLSEVEMDSSSEYALSTSGKSPGVKQSSDELNIEREARERVATMLHRNMGASTEYDFSQASMNTDSFDAAGEASGASGARTPGLHNLRHPMHRNSTGGSSRNSRLSSFHQSTSTASHDEPQAGPSRNIYRAGSSVEHLIPPLNPDDAVTSITVNVVSESESETVVPAQQSPQADGRSPMSSNTLRVQPQGGVLALVHSLPDLTVDPSTPPPRLSHRRLDRNTARTWAKGRQSHVTVRVQPQCGVLALVLSMPDLTELSLPRPNLSPSPQSASEKLYQSHQELLQRNRLSATTQHHQYLTPDHRGTSYPPPSPTRASLKRGLAFSYSLKNPPLSKMGHVNSQSQVHAEAGPSTSQQGKGQGEKSPMPSTSQDKGEKKSKQFINRHKGGSSRNSPSPGRKDKEDKGD